LFFFSFCLDAKERKNQGQPDPSRRLSGLRAAKAQNMIFGNLLMNVIYFLIKI
jgi:hypothetical protein